jgi:elongator complex protein 4
MSFRKRSLVVGQAGSSSPSAPTKTLPPGTRPSPLDGRLTTSTGTASLDALLAGHAGLALGTSLLVEEVGTTDFAGVLTKYFAAEGVVQGHAVHVLGMDEGWGRELPGLGVRKEDGRKGKESAEEKMKIAWRYERLGEFGGARGEFILLLFKTWALARGDNANVSKRKKHTPTHSGFSRIKHANILP